jgi:hypothetical protein
LPLPPQDLMATRERCGMRKRLISDGCGLLLALALGMGAIPTVSGGAEFTEQQQQAYLIWLHSLEAELATREASGMPETLPLYPDAGREQQRVTDEDLLEVARALTELESKPRLLQEPPGRSPLHALNRARSHAHVAAHDSALVWYVEAVQRDTTGERTGDIGPEIMAAAIAAGDGELVRQRLHAALGSVGPSGPIAEIEVELACRFLLARADTVGLQSLVFTLGQHPHLRVGRLAYWQAFVRSWLGHWPQSFAMLTGLLGGDGRTHGLDTAQRAWVLTAIPDQLLLLGDRETAHGLYRALAASSIPEAATWAACQVAALDFLDGRYLAAGNAFEQLCSRADNTTWRRYACDMARLSDELERLRSEGAPHGTAAIYQP